ncbi:UDP-Glycosyltransferase superfamily protein [Actinidia rufa]|uniref:Glycosyltransferase n=1 Tax=Actinidia rufa TaxID=165716 RepID=A0A7J0DZ22_9ERIC|nr:UDP-Glycosyltransferase superfamily protein [Actinidia rufa]
MGSTNQSESQALVSEGSRERGRGQGRGHHTEVLEKDSGGHKREVALLGAFIATRRGISRGIVQSIKAQDQSSDTAATAVMADDDEIDVLLAASDDGKSDWILDSGSAYHLCRDREVFSTYAACEGRIWMANNTSSRVVGRGSVRFRMADGRSVTLTEVRHVPNLRKNLISIGMLDAKGCSFDASGRNSQSFQGKQGDAVGKEDWRAIPIGGECSDRGSYCPTWVQWYLARRVDKGSNRLYRSTQSNRRVQDVHKEAQRKETKSILRSCTAKGVATPKRVSFALDLISGGVLSPVVRTREERWSHDNSQSDDFAAHPSGGVVRPGGGCRAPRFLSGVKAWCLGPFSVYDKRECFHGSPNQHQHQVIMNWLAKQADQAASVIYVSFGTQTDISDAQLDEVAYGLEESGVQFLWPVRSTTWFLPEGMEERMKGKGLIIKKWVDQRSILNHPATGGFLSHCGWNSVLESLLAGVPILAWPMIAEQPLNAKFVVEGLKAGIRVQKIQSLGAKADVRVSRQAICKGVMDLMKGKEGMDARERARGLGQSW